MTREAWLAVGLIALGAAMYATPWTLPAAGRRFAHLFQQAEYSYGLPRHLLARLAQQESGFDPRAESRKGAQGIMQIVPQWHPGVDPFDVPRAIDYAARYLRQQFDRFGSWAKALAAYNAGPTALQKRIHTHGVNWLAHMPAETQSYVASITNDVRVGA